MTKHLRLIMLSLLAMICLGGIRRVKLCSKRCLSQMRTNKLTKSKIIALPGQPR